MGKKSKIKGGNFERKVAKQLTEWWQAAGLEGEFYKTPASGGLRWQKRDDTIGDICTPEGFACTIECKNSEVWDFKELFTETIAKSPPLIKEGKGKGKPNSPRTIGEFWYQACDEASRADRIPLLVFSKNYQKDLIVFPTLTNWASDYSSQLQAWGITKVFKFVPPRWPIDTRTLIVRFDKFLEIVTPEALRKDYEC